MATCVMTFVIGHASCHVSVTQSKASSMSADVVVASAVWLRLEAGSNSPVRSASSGSSVSDDSCTAAHHIDQLTPAAVLLQVFRVTCHAALAGMCDANTAALL